MYEREREREWEQHAQDRKDSSLLIKLKIIEISPIDKRIRFTALYN